MNSNGFFRFSRRCSLSSARTGLTTALMNRRSGLPRGFPRWLVWLTAWVIALSALAPTISRALAHAGSVQWVQVCTSEGIRWIALSDADNGADSGEAGKSALHLDHCPLCVLMGERLAPPAEAPVLALERMAHAAPVAVLRHAVWAQPVRAAHPRGPPALPTPSFAA